MTTRAQYDAFVRLAAKLIEREHSDLAHEVLMILAGGEKAEPEAAPSDPTEPPKKARTRKQIMDAERAAKKRQEARQAATVASDVAESRATNCDASQKSPATSPKVADDVASKIASRARVLKEAEEEKNLCDSGIFSADSESSESSGSSELRASDVGDASQKSPESQPVASCVASPVASDVASPVASPEVAEHVATLRLLNPIPAAAATGDRLESKDVSRAWNRAYQQRHPGGTGHLHNARVHRENFEVIAAVLNGLVPEHRREALEALVEWVWIAPGGVWSRVPFLSPETVVASLDRDLISARQWWLSKTRAQLAQKGATG